MIPVDQKIVDSGKGDCLSATVASLLEISLEEVPHFRAMADHEWFQALFEFLRKMGYEFHGTCYPETYSLLEECPNVGGYLIASVPSKTFEDVTHSVIIDMYFNVVHDPNPNKKWDGELVRDKVKNWFMISKVNGGTK